MHLIRYYSSKPEWWAELAKKNMKEDNSWARSAQAYLDLYRKM
jgi:glycogen synthase